jgi:hypothetical protein
MEHDVDIDHRLRAARPSAASTDSGAFDADLLARVRAQPIAARRRVRRAVALPVAAGATLAVAVVVMLAGGPGEVGGPSSASAISQALRWFDPPPGTILHVRSVETQGGRTTTHETWQSAGDPTVERRLGYPTVERRGDTDYGLETSGDAFYDPATNTIYDPPGASSSKPGDWLESGDPIVQKVRLLLTKDHMEVSGPEMHNGTSAWAISLKPDAGRPVWTLWVSATNGRPLELRDPGRDASEQAQIITWPTYEVLAGSDANAQVTLTGAHPDARVVTDEAEVQAARERFFPAKGAHEPRKPA